MNNELRQEFTRRISSGNKGEMIVVIYDIFYTYVQDAVTAYEKDDHRIFLESTRKAQAALRELQDGLDFSYPISMELFPLYGYAERQLVRSFYQNDTSGLLDAKKILDHLYPAFVDVARQDDSEPVMEHSQHIMAGMTYGKNNLTETVSSECGRGYLA